jgi:hypothetical protein
MQKPHELESRIHPLTDFLRRHLPLLETEGDILVHGHVGPQCVVLKDEPDVALPGGEMRDVPVADQHAA